MADNDNFAEVSVRLPIAVIDRLRGNQSREGWLLEAARRLAREQSGHDRLDPIGWHELDASEPSRSR